MNLTEKDLTVINRALRHDIMGKDHAYMSEVMDVITKIDKLFHGLQGAK